MVNKTQLILIFFGAIFFFASCIEEGANQRETPPILDYEALYIAEEIPSTHLQVLLKMSFLNFRDDILKYGIGSPEEHQKRLNYYIQNFKEDIYLVSGIDTITCIDSHLERLHMDLPYRNFVLTFKKSDLHEEDHLIIKDLIYSNQLVKLSIRNSYGN